MYGGWQLPLPLPMTPATLCLLFSNRVHLAHHHADNGKAIATAAWILPLRAETLQGLDTAIAAREGEDRVR